MKIGRGEISLRIYSKLNGAIHKKYIYDAINIILDSIKEDLVDGKSVSVENLGTLSPYMYHGHKGFNVSTGEIQNHQPFKTVQFRPHSTFKKMISERRERFLK